jgi:hypothetical protein
MKAYRRGLQDYEYAWMLRQGGQQALADETFRRLVPVALTEGMGTWPERPGVVEIARALLWRPLPRAAPWSTDPNAWYAARETMAAALESATARAGAPR